MAVAVYKGVSTVNNNFGSIKLRFNKKRYFKSLCNT